MAKFSKRKRPGERQSWCGLYAPPARGTGEPSSAQAQISIMALASSRLGNSAPLQYASLTDGMRLSQSCPTIQVAAVVVPAVDVGGHVVVEAAERGRGRDGDHQARGPQLRHGRASGRVSPSRVSWPPACSGSPLSFGPQIDDCAHPDGGRARARGRSGGGHPGLPGGGRAAGTWEESLKRWTPDESGAAGERDGGLSRRCPPTSSPRAR